MAKTQLNQQKLRKIIERARREQSKTLRFSSFELGAELEKIPDEIFDLHHLETLSLFNHNIREVPERIRELANLKQLNLIGNPIKKVPDIPGLALDWAAYLRCRKTLSRQNVTGISIDIDNKSSLAIESQLRRELALLPNLHNLSLGPRNIVEDKLHIPTGEI